MKHYARSVLVSLLALWALRIPSQADDALFIGNSFTYGGEEKVVKAHGGVPALVQAIAASKGKTLSVLGITQAGRDWGYHLGQPKTEAALESRKWNWVVLQEYSTKATHMGNRVQFASNGEKFYRRILAESKEAKILLYEPWARGAKSPIYTGTSTSKSFVNPREMTGEIEDSFADLRKKLESITPGDQVFLARVGTAFAHSLKKHPEIDLYLSDYYHANRKGSYLAALVIYGTLFHDSPLGATHEFPAFALDIDEAKKLQAVAEEVVFTKLTNAN